MSKNNFGLEGVQEWNQAEYWRVSGMTSMHSRIIGQLSACLFRRFEWRVQGSGHYFIKNAIVLLTLRQLLRGNTIWKGTEMSKLYFCLKMFVFDLYTFWPFIWLFNYFTISLVNCIYFLIYSKCIPNYVKKASCLIICRRRHICDI